MSLLAPIFIRIGTASQSKAPRSRAPWSAAASAARRRFGFLFWTSRPHVLLRDLPAPSWNGVKHT